MSLAHLVIPRESGVSSTPRLIDSIADVSGILDHPLSRVMTVVDADSTQHPRRLQPSEQQQDQQDDDDEPEAAAAVIAGAVERPAAKAAEAAKQRDDQDNQNDRSK